MRKLKQIFNQQLLMKILLIIVILNLVSIRQILWYISQKQIFLTGATYELIPDSSLSAPPFIIDIVKFLKFIFKNRLDQLIFIPLFIFWGIIDFLSAWLIFFYKPFLLLIPNYLKIPFIILWLIVNIYLLIYIFIKKNILTKLNKIEIILFLVAANSLLFFVYFSFYIPVIFNLFHILFLFSSYYFTIYLFFRTLINLIIIFVKKLKQFQIK